MYKSHGSYGLYISCQRNPGHLVVISQVTTFCQMKMVPAPEKWRRLVTTTVGSKGSLNENGFGHLANISRFHPFVFKVFFYGTSFHRVSPSFTWKNGQIFSRKFLSPERWSFGNHPFFTGFCHGKKIGGVRVVTAHSFSPKVCFLDHPSNSSHTTPISTSIQP